MTIIAKPQMMLLATTKCKILGLPYPGGPLIDKYAQLGNPKAFALQNQKFRIEFQFFRFKSHSLFYSKEKIENPNFVDENLNDICINSNTIIEILMDKLKLAVKKQVLHKSLLAEEFRQILEFETP
jgi:tRNA A37 threonylcarbamoyltransferase TsaD